MEDFGSWELENRPLLAAYWPQCVMEQDQDENDPSLMAYIRMIPSVWSTKTWVRMAMYRIWSTIKLYHLWTDLSFTRFGDWWREHTVEDHLPKQKDSHREKPQGLVKGGSWKLNCIFTILNDSIFYKKKLAKKEKRKYLRQLRARCLRCHVS